ncbi:tyrosine-protein phosphatase [Microbacterium sp. C7(2022)]|uniref:tyrosine-protein phosphatase n=1 Tax=Microbacterium sp. C7(2022) TaxID=2992759 RepID=UPI00237B8C74|nr:tyrosine-protein phosphatase [Microbacterium sp. C7(2022)]MDE0546176.1 tyrosine-protein phosphatase [Microbacterium sp. C7(2022)]
MTLLDIDGTQNFRDTGGIALAGGGVSRSGVFYRSEGLNALTDEGVEQLATTPIGVIIDLRTDAERGMAPDRLPATRPFDVVELPLLEGAATGMAKGVMGGADPEAAKSAIAAAMATIPALSELYVSMLQSSARAFAVVARRVAASHDDEPTAVVVHCTAGKDRTGVAIALVLDAIGADRDAVVADYASSAGYLAGPWADRMRAMVTGMGVPLTEQIDELLTQTPASAIETALAWVDAQGGSTAYLRSGGLTDDELASLRRRLTV